MSEEHDLDRRRFLTYGSATATSFALAGCVFGGDSGAGSSDGNGGDGGDGDTGDGEDGEDGMDGVGEAEWRSMEEPETRIGYLERANLAAHQEAPWIYLNRQFSVYGQATRLDWEPRRDELIAAYEITPTDGDGEVVITQGQLDSGLDPHDHRETPTDNVVTQAHDGVLERDREGTIVEGLAEEWERIEDGHVRFHLREGVTFHNGDDLTPADVAYSVNRIVDPEVGGLESPQRDQLAGVTSAEVAGDAERAVDVFSDGLNPIVFQEFATYCDVVREDWIEERESGAINSDMNGTGPFQVVEYESDVEVVFEAHENYWRGEPDIDRLVFRGASEDSTRVNQLIQGETDVIVNVPPEEVSRVQGESTTAVAPVPSTRVIYNAMRFDVEPFDSRAFRMAMNYAIDLESIIEDVLNGFAGQTGQPTLEGFVGYNEDVDPYPYDPERAEELVEASGYAGAEIELHTPVGRYLSDLEIAQTVAGFVDDLGNVSASVQQRDFGGLVEELLDGDITTSPDWYLIGWGNATFDTSQTLIPLLTSDGALTTFKDEDFDHLVDRSQELPTNE